MTIEGSFHPSPHAHQPCEALPGNPPSKRSTSGGSYATHPHRVSRSRVRPYVALITAALSGCATTQSTLDPQSRSAALIADLWWGMLVVGTLTLLAVVALLLIGLWRTGRGERPLTRPRAWLLVLAGGVALPSVAVLATVIFGVSVGQEIARSPEKGPVVEVVGRLWWWEVRYLDADGEVIATAANEMHVPVGQPVALRLISENVIHSFWVPQLQGKTDLIPGQVNESWIEAAAPGVYRGQCAEYCGVQHALMGFVVVAEPPDAFDRWLALQARPAEAVSDDPVLAEGQEVFLRAGCGDCHTVRGTPARGVVGPDLTHIASRRTLAAATIPNTRGHLAGWITDPQHVKPGAKMPSTAPAPHALQALLAYLGSLE